jgi:hypothetical protein
VSSTVLELQPWRRRIRKGASQQHKSGWLRDGSSLKNSGFSG